MDLVAPYHGSVLHIIDLTTRTSKEGFINRLHSESTLSTLCTFWIDVYDGVPDYILASARSNSISSEVKHYSERVITTRKIALIEAHNKIRVAERCHAYLVTIYEERCIDVPHITK